MFFFNAFFNIQSVDKNINIFCEDFVTCIKANNKENSNTFYTGLFNGKLIEWKINNNFEVNVVKHIYSHYSPITIIELYNRQNIIITAGEDKYIHIRKQYDFELLTAINLNYCYSNPIVSENINIFPSLIKISDLNLLYVILYDLDTETNFIRGYNLNGLFFAQTDPLYFKDQKINLLFNNISFTKNSNLVIGFSNSDKLYILNASNLKPLWIKDIKKGIEKKQKNEIKMIDYNFKNEEFYILYENEFIIMTLKDKKEQKEFDLF